MFSLFCVSFPVSEATKLSTAVWRNPDESVCAKSRDSWLKTYFTTNATRYNFSTLSLSSTVNLISLKCFAVVTVKWPILFTVNTDQTFLPVTSTEFFNGNMIAIFSIFHSWNEGSSVHYKHNYFRFNLPMAWCFFFFPFRFTTVFRPHYTKWRAPV